MRRVEPYKTVTGALRSLDNGGRFYNLLAKADDGRITSAELKKAAGVTAGRDRAVLFLSLAVSGLEAEAQDRVFSCLSDEIRRQMQKNPPRRIPITRFETEVSSGLPVIVEGYPRFVEDRTEFQGFIIIPISTGKVTTFTMIPIFDQFDVYELHSDVKPGSGKTIIATVRGSSRLDCVHTTFAGVVRELTFVPDTEAPHSYYTEALYYAID